MKSQLTIKVTPMPVQICYLAHLHVHKVHRKQISELYRQHKNRTVCNSTKHVKSSVTSQNTHDKSSAIVNMHKLNKERCRLMKECVYINVCTKLTWVIMWRYQSFQALEEAFSATFVFTFCVLIEREHRGEAKQVLTVLLIFFFNL